MDSMYLHGSEDVRRAASMMQQAADEMQRAALNIEGHFDRHQRFLDDWLSRFEQVLAALPTPPDSQGGEDAAD